VAQPVASQRRPQLVAERRRIGDDVKNLGLQQRTILALHDEVLKKLVRKLDRLAHRHAEADEVFGVHGFGDVENGGAQRADTLRVRSGVCSFRRREIQIGEKPEAS
jgi:hypothetical protein